MKKALDEDFSLGILIPEIRSQWSQRATVKEEKICSSIKTIVRKKAFENPEVMNDNYGMLIDQVSQEWPDLQR
jgi:hypothetical protein